MSSFKMKCVECGGIMNLFIIAENEVWVCGQCDREVRVPRWTKRELDLAKQLAKETREFFGWDKDDSKSKGE